VRDCSRESSGARRHVGRPLGVEPGTLAGREQHVLQTEILMMRSGLRKRSQQLRHGVEDHHPMIVVRDLCERDRKVVAIGNLTGRNIGAEQHEIPGIIHIGEHLGRAHSTRAQAK